MKRSTSSSDTRSTYARCVDLVVRHGTRFPDFEGLEIRALLPGQLEYEAVTGKLYPALRLFADNLPLRFRYLQRDLPRIHVGLTPAAASCVSAAGVCLIGHHYLTDPKTSPADVAMTLVHEGTHARLSRLGIGYGPAIRARVERICTRSEILLARRLDGAAPLMERAERRLRWPDEVWSDAAHKARYEAYLRDLGVGVVGRLMVRVVAPIVQMLLRLRRRVPA